MIISYRRKFTFLHIPKTAGSSVNLYLAPHLGPLDIMLGGRDERRERRIRPNVRARVDAFRAKRKVSSLSIVLSPRIDTSERVLNMQEKVYKPHFGPVIDHPNARQVRDFDGRAWDRHFKFGFVRNPYERMISMYLHLTRKAEGERDSFANFLPKLMNGAGRYRHWRNFIEQWPFFAIDNRVAVDFVGRYERLSDDFQIVCGHLGLPCECLPRAKIASRYDFRDFYTDDLRRMVGRLCEREIDYFGYRFS